MSKEKENFETSLKKLEKILEELQDGNLELDLMLEKFREGAELIKSCKNELNRAENEFKKIKESIEDEPAN